MSKRPHYVPLVRMGELPNRSPSPRAMFLELVIDPLILAAFAAYLLLHGDTLVGVLAIAFFILFIVEAVIYIPRALPADHQERQL